MGRGGSGTGRERGDTIACGYVSGAVGARRGRPRAMRHPPSRGGPHIHRPAERCRRACVMRRPRVQVEAPAARGMQTDADTLGCSSGVRRPMCVCVCVRCPRCSAPVCGPADGPARSWWRPSVWSDPLLASRPRMRTRTGTRERGSDTCERRARAISRLFSGSSRR